MGDIRISRTFNVQTRYGNILFDRYLGEGGFNTVLRSSDGRWVARFPKVADGDEVDSPQRQVRLFNEHYGESLCAEVLTYDKDDSLFVIDSKSKTSQRFAVKGNQFVLMRFCPHTTPTDDEIVQAVLKEIQPPNNRLIYDGHVPGNAIKLTEDVGELKVGSIIFIDFGEDFRLGRDKNLPQYYSQESLDTLDLDGYGKRIIYKQYYDKLLKVANVHLNPKAQSVIKSLAFIEELFPSFHDSLYLLDENRAWIPILSEAYHLFPYGSGMPKEISEVTKLDECFIEKLCSANLSRMREFEQWFVDDFKMILPSGDSPFKLAIVSELAYFYDHCRQFSDVAVLNCHVRKLARAYQDFFVKDQSIKAQDDAAVRIKEATSYFKNIESLLKPFGSFNLLGRENILVILDNHTEIRKRIEAVSGLPWTRELAELIIAETFPYVNVVIKMRQLGLLSVESVSECFKSNVKLLLDTLLRIAKVRPLCKEIVLAVIETPLLVAELLGRLERLKILTNDVVKKAIKDLKSVLRGVTLLEPHGLCNSIFLAQLGKTPDYSECLEILSRLGLGSKSVFESLFSACDVRYRAATVILKDALLQGVKEFACDEVKVFACQQYSGLSELDKADTGRLLIAAVRILSGCDFPGANVPSLFTPMPPTFDLARLGGLRSHFESALALLSIGETQWKAANDLGDYASLKLELVEYTTSMIAEPYAVTETYI